MKAIDKYNLWIISTSAFIIIFLFIFALPTIYIDPFFHYHAPLSKYEYPLSEHQQMYINDGITRHFEYDSIITGTSMTGNFKTSEADEIFSANFVKLPYFAAPYVDINNNLIVAFKTGKEIKNIIRCIDNDYIADLAPSRQAQEAAYLHNTNPFDDVNYIFNKTVFFQHTAYIWNYTASGNKTTSFDDYSNWNDRNIFGASTVLSTYQLAEPATTLRVLSQERINNITENLQQNVVLLASEHPKTTFYLFFPPYSICYWDKQDNSGAVNFQIDIENIAIEELIKQPNIKLFSFNNNFELICNLENYKDPTHYGEWVNSWILEWMANDEYLLTEDNYQEYLAEIRDFYTNYDYASLHE